MMFPIKCRIATAPKILCWTPAKTFGALCTLHKGVAAYLVTSQAFPVVLLQFN